MELIPKLAYGVEISHQVMVWPESLRGSLHTSRVAAVIVPLTEPKLNPNQSRKPKGRWIILFNVPLAFPSKYYHPELLATIVIVIALA